ncbi:hypothetical protein HB662_28650 [Roseomonas frigidaquae]|uniref:ABC transmembrane type-1 domain-containing protein n=1 Tax=Falsiroseomonas frigidaquae TaxID=487318 RepID=A0ABX1F962_9PROT|nr:hypothetical protein [Falsiroseomonas frigidaquae]NKE48769.1 hypothetical protein [Falsiroseomonas frigidaquae]
MPVSAEKSPELQFSLALEELKARYTEIGLLNTQLQAVNTMAVTVIAGISGLIGWKFTDPTVSGIGILVRNIEIRLVLAFVATIFLSLLLLKQFLQGRMSRQASYIEQVLRPKFALILAVELKDVLSYESYIGKLRVDFLNQRAVIGAIIYDNLIFAIPYFGLVSVIIYGAFAEKSKIEIVIYAIMFSYGIWRWIFISGIWKPFNSKLSLNQQDKNNSPDQASQP